MNSIFNIYNSVLKYNNNEINFIIDLNGNIWFKFINITQLLNYKSRKDALRLIKNDNKKLLKNIKTFNKTNNHPNTVFIDEIGLYMFLIRSKMKNAIEFQLWLVSEVLPNLRKFGKYEVNRKIKNKLKILNNKIKELEKTNLTLKNNLTKNKYPTGEHIYIISDDSKYKIGYTKNLKKRLEVYNTGNANKSTYVYYKKTNCANEIEKCVKALLNRFIYKSNKEFYDCSLDKIIEAINKCIKIEKKCSKCNEININNMQNGGTIENNVFIIAFYDILSTCYPGSSRRNRETCILGHADHKFSLEGPTIVPFSS
jgi:prophage antirepressor-like protein